MMRQLLRYWHTVRYLRPVQLYGRARQRLLRPRAHLSSPPRRRTLKGSWTSPAERSPSLLGPDQFNLLNETHALAEHGWDDASLAKLWRYNLHYFDDLNARRASERAAWHVALISRWVRENPPGHGTPWEPYPTSLRIVNWIKWALGGGTLPAEAIESLAVQSRWLAHRLETHLLGNHLFANAKALTFAGAFFAGAEAERWIETGLTILEGEVPEQILPDGGHFERSPMYHALALEDMLDLCNLSSAIGPVAAPRLHRLTTVSRARVDEMRRWLAAMCHPDGEISFFNDAAIGIAPTPAELEGYAKRLGFPGPSEAAADLVHLSASGYIRVSSGGAVALLDVAPIGPDYLPGHAHADTLSFEFSLHRQRVFVNTGTSQYGADAERLRQRSTAAHNTVVIDAENSSEVWSGFRVARRARPVGLYVQQQRPLIVRCAHDGYRRLRGKVTHTRTWTFAEQSLDIEDRLTGTYSSAQARFLVHPGVSTIFEDELSATLVLPGGGTIRVTADGGTMRHERSTWHPRFGRSEPTACLVIDFVRSVLRTRIVWIDTP